jgi:hypothetical protein
LCLSGSNGTIMRLNLPLSSQPFIHLYDPSIGVEDYITMVCTTCWAIDMLMTSTLNIRVCVCKVCARHKEWRLILVKFTTVLYKFGCLWLHHFVHFVHWLTQSRNPLTETYS